LSLTCFQLFLIYSQSIVATPFLSTPVLQAD
jgi:hypothetical protein